VSKAVAQFGLENTMRNRGRPEKGPRHLFPNLGIESHDALNHACVYPIQALADQGLELRKIRWVDA
jgi:aminopeptidase-like protein